MYSGWAKVRTLTIGTTGDLYIYLDGTLPNPAGCSNANAAVVDTAHVAKAMYVSIFTTAWATQKSARIVVSGTQCVGAFPKVLLGNVTR